MKVCIVTLHPADDRRVFARGAQTLLDAGLQVDLVATQAVESSFQGSAVSGLQVFSTLPLERSPIRRAQLHWQLFRLARKSRADVYHTHDPELLPMVLWLSRQHRAETVYDVHEFYSRQWSRKVPTRFRRFVTDLIDWFEKRLAARCRNVIVVDPAMVEPFEAAGCNVLLAPNHVLARAYPPSTADSNASELLIASTGTISEARGSLILAEICNRLAESDAPIRFLIWERAYSSRELSNFHEKLGGPGPNVELIKPMAPEQLAARLSECHIGISTLQDALQYPFSVPSKLFEFMSARLAIVASDLPATRRVLEPLPHATLVAPDDPGAYVSAVERLVNDRALLEEARNEARLACLETYDWAASVAPGYAKFFKRLGEPQRPGCEQ